MTKPPIVVFLGDTHVGSDTGLAKPNFYLESKERVYPISDTQTWLYENWQASCKDIEKLADIYSVIMCFGGDGPDGQQHHDSIETFGNRHEQREMAIELYEMAAQFAVEKWMVPGTIAHIGQQGDEDRSIATRIGARISPYYRLEICGRILDWAHHGLNLGKDVTRWSSTMSNAARLLWLENMVDGDQQPDLVVRHHTHRSPRAIFAHGMWVAICPAWQMTGDFVNGFHPTGKPSIGHLVWDPITNAEPELKLYEYQHRVTQSSFAGYADGGRVNIGDTSPVLDNTSEDAPTWGTDDKPL